jgi:hypothetical protein
MTAGSDGSFTRLNWESRLSARKPVLHASLEIRPCVAHPGNQQGSGASVVLSTHKYAIHNWQAVQNYPSHQDPLQSKHGWATPQWAVWVQTQIQHCTTAHPPIREWPGIWVKKPRPVQLLEEPIHRVDTTHDLAVTLIHSVPRQLMLIRWERKWHRDWEGRGLSYTEVVSASGMKFCCTISSSELWRTMRASCGGLSLASLSGNCRCFNASVFALQPFHLGTFVWSKFTRIWEFLSLMTTSDRREIRLKLSWCAIPTAQQSVP